MTNEKIIYKIPTDPEYYGPDVTEAEGKEIAKIIKAHVEKQFNVECEIVTEVFSSPNRNDSDNEIVAQIENYIDLHWTDWLED